MEIVFIILLFVIGPAIMFAIGASQFAKAAETMNEVKRLNEQVKQIKKQRGE